MAERTHTFARFDDGAITVSYVYDDADNKHPLRIVIVNDHATKTISAGIEHTTTGWHREGSWGPQTGTTIIEVPPGQREKYDLVPDGGSPPGEDYSTLGDVLVWAGTSDG